MRALNTDHMMRSLKAMSQLLIENVGTIKLLIVDSIMALFRTDYQGQCQRLVRIEKNVLED